MQEAQYGSRIGPPAAVTIVAAPGRMDIARMAVGTTVGNMLGVSCTVSGALGTMLVPIATDLDWSRTEVAGAFTAVSLAGAAMFPFAGRLADRFGTRPVLIVGYLLLGLAIMALSLAPPHHVGFYALFALSGAVGALPSTMVLSKLISERLDRGRGFWMGLTSGIGNAVGASAMPLVAATLMARVGWRGAFGWIGLAVLLIGVPVAALLLRQSRTVAAQSDGPALSGVTLGQAIRSPMFWLILSAVPVAGGSLTAVLANVVPIMTERGLTLGQATGVVAAFAMVCSVWKPLVGWLLDRSRRPVSVAPFYLLASFGLVGLAQLRDAGMLLASGVLAGVGLGAEFSVMLYILSRYFGLRAMGAISGIAYTVVLVSNAIMALALNLSFDRLGSYAPALIVSAAMLLYNAVLFLMLPPFPRDGTYLAAKP